MSVSITSAGLPRLLAVALALSCAVGPGAVAQESGAPAAQPFVTPPVAADTTAPVAVSPQSATSRAPAAEPTQPAAAAAPAAATPETSAPQPAAAAADANADAAAGGAPVGDTMMPSPAAPITDAAADTVAATKPADGNITADKLPHDLSPWNMFMSADIIVKAVMLGLLFASFATWTVWLAKSVELIASKRRVMRALRQIDGARSLGELEGFMQQRRGVGQALLKATVQELHASWGAAAAAGIKERIQSRLDRLELAAARDINKGTGVLATIGSTAPFVGLFGTVWGIMNSFIGISESKTTNLAIVAPGIAEALLATAFGLVAAIPAVIFYNQLARSIGGYKALVGDTAAATMRLASRDLERGTSGAGLRAAE